MDSAPIELTPTLMQILDGLADRAFAAKLRKVYFAAAQAITKLSDIDLVKYETGTVDTAPDLSLWEEMAPVIRDTVMDVNGLLSAIREQFPSQGGLEHALSSALEDTGSHSPEARRIRSVTQAMQATMMVIAQEITELGELMRNPNVVSDRWNLLAELQRFRSRFREQIGDLVYETASTFQEIRREDVVPGHAEAVSAALLVRATVADLRRVTGSRVKSIQDSDAEDVQWNAQQLEKELDMFGQTPAYGALRAQDKRAVIEFRQSLGELARRPNIGKPELLALVQPFAEMVASWDQVNRRQILIAHDREVLAACGVRLEHAESMLTKDPPGAARVMAEAALTAQSLYGRDAELDTFLRKSRKTSLSALTGKELQQTLETLRMLLANLHMSL
ncbi:MAG TPA: hypothetical protein VK447_20765 [Myxococcaceae bacterium]|nr:hypothetical protein [Myxococcaceae bacterium]